jgi:bis(5'-nucleosyl)-tetraphosphatase (symmetrical)
VATYAIGDIQGCFDSLERLLERIAFVPKRDRLCLLGDLVNRGPDSAKVLRWAVRHADHVTAVLGNHDLHLIARDLGLPQPRKPEQLEAILAAKDREELVTWLRAQPLVHREGGFLMVHAGLLPAWTAAEAEGLSKELSRALAGEQAASLLAAFYELGARAPELEGATRLPGLLQVFTRLRTIAPDGRPAFGFSGSPMDAPAGCRPWFELRRPGPDEPTIVFGHWAALGLYVSETAIGLDTGCVWGGSLTALRLEDHTLFQQPAV